MKNFTNEGIIMPNQDKRTTMGKMLAQVRKAHRLTQEQVAEILKIKRSTYAYYERNITPTLDNISRLSTLFSISTHELMFGEPDPILLKNLKGKEPLLGDPGSIFPTTTPGSFGQLYPQERQFLAKYRMLPPNMKEKIEQEIEMLLAKNEQ